MEKNDLKERRGFETKRKKQRKIKRVVEILTDRERCGEKRKKKKRKGEREREREK